VTEKKNLIIASALGVLAAGGLGWMIYAEYGAIAQSRETVASTRASIDAARKLLVTTPQLEKDVIVLRETEETIREILPDEQDVNNFVRTLQRFEEDSNVRITSLKKKDAPTTAKKTAESFDKVAYELSLEADAFQLFDFLDRIESHARFIRVPSFSVTAASRKQVEDKGVPSHKVRMEVETFVYKPQSGLKQVEIDGYARKRELLLGEISRRRQALQVATYQYTGSRGRRDPWVDPRIPVAGQDVSQLPLQEQARIVDELSTRMTEVAGLWTKVQAAPNVVEEMTLRAELELKLGKLEEDARRVVADGSVSFVPSQRRLQLEVLDAMANVRAQILASSDGRGPTADTLKELLATMKRHVGEGEPNLALIAFQTIEPSLDAAVRDPLRAGLVEALRKCEQEAHILADFQKLDIKVTGVAIAPGSPPVALINGRALGEGDLVNDELVVRSIRQGEIEFIFRGVVLVRRF
jgi:hypothetical protein